MGVRPCSAEDPPAVMAGLSCGLAGVFQRRPQRVALSGLTLMLAVGTFSDAAKVRLTAS